MNHDPSSPIAPTNPASPFSGRTSVPSLILFDIDATLITTAGLGVRAMVQTGRELHGEHFHADGIEFGGGLDPVLISKMFQVSSVQSTPERLHAFCERYPHHLGKLLESAPTRRALPGVLPLLAKLTSANHATLGLLTGNFEQTGLMKLHACGIDTDCFKVRVWGNDSPHEPPDRAHLPIVAMQRYQRLTGRDVDPQQVIVIGDTPHDVRAARTCGCRSIGVATGRHSIADLAVCGADWTVADLSDTQGVIRWMIEN